MGIDRAAPLRHAVDFGLFDPKPLGGGGERQHSGDRQDPLSADSGDDQVVLHGLVFIPGERAGSPPAFGV